MSSRAAPLPLSAYPQQIVHRLRYADLDPNNHVNNAATAVLFEVGRTEFLHGPIKGLIAQTAATVIVRIAIDFRGEIHWPGDVTIATGVSRLGSSSIGYAQALFQNGVCTTTAEVAAVHIDRATRRPLPLTPEQRAVYERYRLREPNADNS